MSEKKNIEVSTKVANLIEANKESEETTDAFLLRLLSDFSEDETIRRILFIGPPAAGKSTIRRVFFENTSPKEMMNTPLEPTRGIENYVYNWLDVSAGIADSAGQEIEKWLGFDQELAFGESDSIIFVVDIGQFDEYKDQILEDLNKSLDIRRKIAPKSHYNIFLHKIDLFNDEEREEKIQKIQTEINNSLKENDHKADMILLKYYHTSIKDEFILKLVKSMREVLYSYSKIMRRALIPYSMRL